MRFPRFIPPFPSSAVSTRPLSTSLSLLLTWKLVHHQIGRRPKEKFLQRRCTDGQQTRASNLNRSHYSVQFSSVNQSCPILCDPMDCNTAGFPVHHQLQELVQIYWVGDAFQPSHPPSSHSPPAFNLSQHQGIFQWVSSSHQVGKVWVSAPASILPMNIQGWFPFGWNCLTSLLSKGLSRVFSNTTVQKLQFFGAQLSL